jgi:heptose-I-phosphate ethanolaminephosphotransferase
LLAIIILLTNTILEILYVLLNKTQINGTGLKIFFESNKNELQGYAAENVSVLAYIALIILLFLAYKILRSIKHNDNKFKYSIPFFIFFIFLIGSYIALVNSNSCFGYGPFYNIHKAFMETKSYYRDLRNLSINKQKFIENYQYQRTETTEKKLYVLIIGESTSRKHMSIYNYYRNTNPLLSKRSDISIYDDVISSRANTLSSLSEALTLKDSITKKQDFTCVNIINICKLAGIKTFWLSNQASMGFWDNSVALTARNADYVAFTTSETNDNLITSRNYDENLLPLLNQKLNIINENSFLVIHIMGSHSPYYKRYPKVFSRFTDTLGFAKNYPFANLDDRRETVNEYDNSIAYNDIIIDSIFTMLKINATKKKIFTSAIYFSDHGEEMYDVDKRIGHDEGYKSNIQHEIPFLTWNSAGFKTDSSYLTRSYMLNNFVHTLTHWMNIRGTGLDSNKSIFSKNFIPSERKIYNRIYTK